MWPAFTYLQAEVMLINLYITIYTPLCTLGFEFRLPHISDSPMINFNPIFLQDITYNSFLAMLITATMVSCF